MSPLDSRNVHSIMLCWFHCKHFETWNIYHRKIDAKIQWLQESIYKQSLPLFQHVLVSYYETSTGWEQRQEMKVVGRYFYGIKLCFHFAQLYGIARGQTPEWWSSIIQLCGSISITIYRAPWTIIRYNWIIWSSIIKGFCPLWHSI